MPINAGTVIDNYGTLSFTGLNTNGATTFYNRTNATMSAPTFQLGSNSTFTNDGLMTATGDLNTTVGTTLTNNYRMEVDGNFNPDGTFTNNGRAYAKNFINMNSSATIINNCTLVSYNGFNSNNPNVTNNGTILITQPNNKWQHNASGVFRNGPNAKVAGYDFINNSTITGSGAIIFSGSTTNQGAFTGNSASDKINFYDETQTGSQFFDFQNTAPTNTVRTAFTRPTELDSPTTCSTGYKSFALAGTTGTITGTVYTDSNLTMRWMPPKPNCPTSPSGCMTVLEPPCCKAWSRMPVGPIPLQGLRLALISLKSTVLILTALRGQLSEPPTH